MAKFKNGDRVKGLGDYQGKVGRIYRVINSNDFVICWDDNPFRVRVTENDIELLEDTDQ